VARSVDAYLAEFEDLSAERRLWEPVWQELAEFITPRKSNILMKRSPGQRQTERLFDSVGFEANELLASTMQGSLTSSALLWFNLYIDGLKAGEVPSIDQWLESSTRKAHRAVASSNHSAESHEYYSDLSALGTGGIFEDELPRGLGNRFQGLRFLTLTPGSYSIAENSLGLVDKVHVEHLMTAYAAHQEFGNRVGRQVAAALQREPSQRFPFLHIVGRRAGVPEWDFQERQPRPSKMLPWESAWVDVSDKIVVRESGFHEFPYMIARWAKSSGETWGRGPGYIALPDIKTVNKTVEMKLRALAKIVNPPVKVRDGGVIGTVDLTSSGITYVRDMEAVDVMNLRIEIEKIEMEEERLRSKVRRIFYSDQLQLQEGPQMTAYEVQVRYELMQRVLGPTLGRLESEYLNRLVVRTFWILFRAGVLDPMPPELLDFIEQGGGLSIRYEGPLARAQRLSETVADQRLLQYIVPIIQIDPTVADVINGDEMVRGVATNLGVRAEVIRSAEDVHSIRQQRAEEAARQAQQQQALMIAEGMGKAAPAIREIGQSIPPRNTIPSEATGVVP